MSTNERTVCTHCGRQLEVCSFCDEEACGHALCYRCTITALGEEIAEPHDHGG